MAEKLQVAFEARNLLSPEIAKVRKNFSGLDRQLDQTNARFRKFEASTVRTGRAFRDVRPAFQNASFQIQDIAVQLSAGTAGAVVLAQQLPQLVSGFGAVGAGIGAVVAVVAGLVVAFRDGGEEAEGLSGAQKLLNSISGNLTTNLGIQKSKVIEVAESYLEADRATRLFTRSQVASAKIGLAEQIRSLSDYTRAATGRDRILRDSQIGLIRSTGLQKEFNDAIVKNLSAQQGLNIVNKDALAAVNNLFKQYNTGKLDLLGLSDSLLDVNDQFALQETRIPFLAGRLAELSSAIKSNGELSELQKILFKGTNVELEKLIGTKFKAKAGEDKLKESVDNTIKSLRDEANALREAEDPAIALQNRLAEISVLQKKFPLDYAILKENAIDAFNKATEEASKYQGIVDDLSGAMTSSFTSAFTSFIDGSKSASEAFKDFAKSVIDSIIEIAIQEAIAKPLGGMLGGFLGDVLGTLGGSLAAPAGVSGSAATPGQQAFPSGAGIGFRARGGPVTGGQSYVVGEEGPELFTAPKSGRIVPNNQMGGGGGGLVINQSINFSTGVQQTVRAEVINLMPQIAQATKAAVSDAKQRGGSFGRSLGS